MAELEEGYWKQGQYARLDGSGRRRSRLEFSIGCRNRKRRSWRIKIAPRLRIFRLGSAKKLLIRLRDAYVKMMLRFAHSSVFRGRLPYGGDRDMGFGRPALKEYDEKVVVEIYKSLMVPGQLMGGVGGGIAF